jgi:hypothetical protein
MGALVLFSCGLANEESGVSMLAQTTARTTESKTCHILEKDMVSKIIKLTNNLSLELSLRIIKYLFYI